MGITYSCCKRRGRLLEKATATSRMDYFGEISAGEQREGLFSHSSNFGGAGDYLDYHSKFRLLSFADGDKRLIMHDWPKFGIWDFLCGILTGLELSYPPPLPLVSSALWLNVRVPNR